MAGPFYEFVKVALDFGNIAEGIAKSMGSGAASEAIGRGAGKEVYEKASKTVGKHKKDIAGLGIGALAGRALARRGSLGALLGLAAARHKDIGEAAKKGYEGVRKKVS